MPVEDRNGNRYFSPDEILDQARGIADVVVDLAEFLQDHGRIDYFISTRSIDRLRAIIPGYKPTAPEEHQKVIFKELSGLQDNEAEVLMALKDLHPHIVRIDETLPAISEGKPVYLVEENLEAGLLFDLIKKKRIDPREPEANTNLWGVMDALATAYEARQVLHRDLTPFNMKLDHNGVLKLIDFGFGIIGKAPSTNKLSYGTRDYMSPEAHSGRTMGHRSDIFSFGAVLYEILKAHGLFDENVPDGMPPGLLDSSDNTKGLNKLLLGNKHERYVAEKLKQRFPGLQSRGYKPNPLERVILTACDPNPKNRYESMRSLNYDLQWALCRIG